MCNLLRRQEMAEQISTLNEIERVQQFKKFYEVYYYPEVLENIRKGATSLTIDFKELTRFNPELADKILEEPEDTLKLASTAIEMFDTLETVPTFSVRVKNLPPSQNIPIRNIRTKHINKLIWVEGIVRQKSDVRPQVTSARFECPGCGSILNILQLDQKFKEPTKCGCGRKGKFHRLSKELIDAQSMTIEENTEGLEGGQPKRIKTLLKNDLVSPIADKKTNPGSKLIIVGQLKEQPIILRTGVQSTRFDYYIEANYVQPLEEEFGEVKINKEEEKEIKELSQDPRLFKKLIDSLAPSIFGHDKIKEALLLQLVGGMKKKLEEGVIIRGDSHILLVGDPGAAKSQLLKRVEKVAPKARYVAGQGASGIGLTAAVVKDDFLQGYCLEAGALVLAHRGLCCIDEFDKMPKEDTSKLHEAMEQQTVSVSKANIQATLRAETTVLAAANPRHGRFDPFGNISEQIELPSTLINRFDLIFPIKDIPDEETDKQLTNFILDRHCNNCMVQPDISTEKLRKYLAYAKQKMAPLITKEARDALKAYYLLTRKSGQGEGIKSIPISARQLEGLIRLSEASAKLRLSNAVEAEDARRAIDLLNFCLRQIAIDVETGLVDIDRLSTGVTSTQRQVIHLVKEIIEEKQNQIGKLVPLEEIMDEARTRNIKEDKVEQAIQKLKTGGELFEPRPGFIQKL